MAHWFHRNPLKATAPVSFNLYGVASSRGAVRICNELRTSRARLLEAFCDAASTPELVRAAADAYFSLLQGFIVVAQPEPDDGAAEEPPENNKMRFVQKFTWTDTLQGSEAKPGAQRDAVFELASMAFNVALWYTKSASRLAGKEDVTEAEAKDIHRGLRVAAGVFRHLRDVQVPRLVAVAAPAVGGGEGGGLLRDLEARVLDAYEAQCLAEAQEVTIARAVALKHEASLVAALSLETAELYRTAERALGAPEPVQCGGKWRKYLQLKRSFYAAHAFCYHAQTLLAADKCGESIRCLQKAEQCYGRAEALCKDYRRTRGPGSTAKPSEQLFFLRLGRIIGDALAKSQRENDFIYFHKVPAEEPRLELKASYGLAEPVAFQLPGLSELCTAEALAAFDLAKRARPDKSAKTAAKPEEEEVKPVKEPDMKPQKDTGCVVS